MTIWFCFHDDHLRVSGHRYGADVVNAHSLNVSLLGHLKPLSVIKYLVNNETMRTITDWPLTNICETNPLDKTKTCLKKRKKGFMRDYLIYTNPDQNMYVFRNFIVDPSSVWVNWANDYIKKSIHLSPTDQVRREKAQRVSRRAECFSIVSSSYLHRMKVTWYGRHVTRWTLVTSL